jgi:hypothetical protein
MHPIIYTNFQELCVFFPYVMTLAKRTKDILYHLVSKVKILKLNTFILIEKIIE